MREREYVQQKLQQKSDELQAVERRLRSGGLKFKEAIGLGANDLKNDLKDQTYLFELDNKKLSSADLAAKKAMLEKQCASLQQEISEIDAMRLQAEIDAKVKQEQQLQELRKKEQTAAQQLYKADPLKFIAPLLFDPQNDANNSRERIMQSARELLTIANNLDARIDNLHLWQAWKLVAQARDIQPREFAPGAEKMFQALLSKLPSELSGLRLLYADQNYKRVDYYLQKYYLSNLIATEDLTRDLETIFNKQALNILNREKSFSKLPPSLKSKLVQVQAYTLQLRSNLDLSKPNIAAEALDAQLTQMQSIIINIINNKKLQAENLTKLDELQSEVTERASSNSFRIR